MSCISCIAIAHGMTRRACSDVCVRSPRRACIDFTDNRGYASKMA